MTALSRLVSLWRNLLHRDLAEQELSEELRAYLELLIDAKTKDGLPPAEARRAALIEMGGVEQVKERVREVKMGHYLETTLQDLRYGVRMLRRGRGITIVAVISLALGIGASTTIFSLVDTLFYRALPAREPDRLVRVYGSMNGRGYSFFSNPEYVHFRDHSTSFETLAAHYSYAPLNVVTNGDSEEVQGAVVSASYFPLVGVEPLLGRFFQPLEDAVPDRDPVAVISFDYWQQRCAGDSTVIGRQIRINGTDFQVIGVAPKAFHGIMTGASLNEIWIPLAMLHVGYRWCDGFSFDCRTLQLIGRLAPDRTLGDARAELDVLASQLAAANRPTNEGRGVTLVSAIGVEPREQQAASFQMGLLMAVAALLLVIACANVAGLLIMRATARRKEIAMRLSLGASRARVVRQLLAESLLLALPGGALGLAISLWAKDLLVSFYATDTEGYRRFYDLSLNTHVLAYAFAVTTVTGLLFGLAPALRATRQDLVRTLKDDGSSHSSGHQRFRGALVVGQVALSLAMLVGAGLIMRSAANVQNGVNFDPADVALLRLRPRLMSYDPTKAQAFTREALRRVEALPGVQSVSLAKGIGLAWQSSGSLPIRRPEQAQDRPENELHAEYHEIAPHFFQTLRIPLIQGRDFDDRDHEGSPPVVIVNQTLAEKIWPEGPPLGRVLMVNDRPFEVVGVFKDARLRNALEAPVPFLYVPYWQNAFAQQVDSRMVVRVAADPQLMLPLIRRELASIDPDVPITEAMPMTEQVKGVYLPVLLTRGVVVSAGLIALLLSMIGLYGVLASAVAQRTREIGIRMALGAQVEDVLKLVVGHGVRLTLIGIVVGLVVALTLTGLMASLLYGVSATDPATFVIMSLFLMAAALGACLVPARRAMTIEPMVALRHE